MHLPSIKGPELIMISIIRESPFDPGPNPGGATLIFQKMLSIVDSKMFEIEIKLKIRNKEELKSKLLKDFKGIHKINLVNYDLYYNKPVGTGDFSHTDEALRVRSTTEIDIKTRKILKNTNDITYKGPKLDNIIKSRVEHVCKISDSDIMDLILQALGYRKVISILKQREVIHIEFQEKKIECLIDKIENLEGWYFEAEVMVENHNELNAIKELLLEFITAIGYEKSDIIVDSYLDLIQNR